MGYEIVDLSAVVLLLAFIVYVLTGGADFGGGLWDLVACGSRRVVQRKLISEAIGPVWEANHVWLIVVVVIMFSCFPAAFAALSVAVHIPIVFVVAGIIFRGVAFAFKGADTASYRRWRIVFALTSTITPVFLGVVIATITTGELHWHDGVYLSGYFAPWLEVLPFCFGLLMLLMCAFLAACYLCIEALPTNLAATNLPAKQLQNDFRLRAIGSWMAMIVMLAVVLFLLALDKQNLMASDVNQGFWVPASLFIVFGLLAFVMLLLRKYFLARSCAVIMVAMFWAVYGLWQKPYIVRDSFTIYNSSAPDLIHYLILSVLAGGALLLIPALAYLMISFKGYRIFQLWDRGMRDGHDRI